MSPVSTGWAEVVCTKLCAARLYTSVGRCSRSTLISEASSSRSPVTSSMLVLDVEDPLEVERARRAHHPDDVVALFEQELGQVRAVLPGDARDKCAPGHRDVLPAAARQYAARPSGRTSG